MSPLEDAKEYSQLLFPLPECRIQAFGERRKMDLKQLRYFANNWFSSWLQLSREASFSPAIGKSIFVVKRQLALVGEIAISSLESFNLFLFLCSCTLYKMSQKKSLSEFLD